MTAIRALAAILVTATVAPSSVVLPGAAGGIGFDDLRFSDELHALVVPAGRTGRIDLVDPRTGEVVDSIAGFSRAAAWARGHEQGTTSADVGEGHVFAIDRTDRTLAAVQLASRRIVARAKLGGSPDYVRWVGRGRELWVTEPDRELIEIFRFEPGSPAQLLLAGTVPVPGGPESLAVDASSHRAYTNTFHGETVAVDVDAHAIAARWSNRCRGARGIALDRDRRLLFVGCAEGSVVALDLAHGGGTVTGAARTGEGVDVIAYSPRLAHLYVAASDSATLTVLGVGGRGELRVLGTFATVPDAHCAAADDLGRVYVCDPPRGRLLVFRDPYAAAR